jgi:N4-gp56 family major capsid protein
MPTVNYTTTGSSSLGGTAGSAGLVQKAYDRLLEFALRSEPLIRSVADKRPARQAIPGSTVVLQRYVDLATSTTPLTETDDVDSVALSTPTSVTITLAEYGNSVLVTRALELFSLADVDPAIANIIAFNLADSIDEVAMTTLRGGTNVIYGGTRTSTATLTASDTLDSADIRKAVAKLRAAKAVARKGSLYWTGIHPEVSHDLRAESSSGQGWLLPNQYGSSQDRIWAGEIGNYEGAYYVESARLFSSKSGANQSTLATTAVTVAGTSAGFTFGVASSSVIATRAEVGDKINGTGIATDALITAISTSGSTTTFTVGTANTAAVTATTVVTVTPVTRVFNTIVCGQQAMAQAVAEEPHVVIGPVVDKLMRHRPMGWYGVLGFARYREEALYRIETGSSIAAL